MHNDQSLQIFKTSRIKRDKDFDVIFVIYLHITILIDFLGIFEYKKGAMCK